MKRMTHSRTTVTGRDHTLSLMWRLPRNVLRTCAPLIALLLCLVLAASATEALADGSSSAQPVLAEVETKKPTVSVSPVVAERLLRANRNLESGRLDDALDDVDELVHIRKLKPADLAQIHRFRGYILTAKGNTDGAAHEFESALDQDALDDGARQGMIYSLAQIYTQAGKYDRARDLLDRWFAAAADPKPEAFFLKAMILVQQEAFAEALAPAILAVEKTSPPRESWLQLLAAIQFQLRDYPAVAGTLKKLIAVAPATKRYWVQLATIENSIGHDEGALATLGVAHVAGLLDDDREYRQRARLCFVRDLPDCCARTMEQGLAAGIVKADGDAYQLLANCYIAARETDRALEPLAKAGELSSDGKGYLMLGQLELQQDRFSDARSALEKARAKAKPEQHASIELLIGIAHLGSDRFDDAERAFRLARADEKTRAAADSYLKHLEQKRTLRQPAEPPTTAGTDTGDPVSSAANHPSAM